MSERLERWRLVLGQAAQAELDVSLSAELAGMDRRVRIHGPQTMLQLPDGGGAIVDQDLGKRSEDRVVGRVHHQDRFHPLPILRAPVSEYRM